MPIESWTEFISFVVIRKMSTTGTCGCTLSELSPQTLCKVLTFVGIDPVAFPQGLVPTSEML